MGEWLFNPSLLRAKGDRSVRARALPICKNENQWQEQLINIKFLLLLSGMGFCHIFIVKIVAIDESLSLFEYRLRAHLATPLYVINVFIARVKL